MQWLPIHVSNLANDLPGEFRRRDADQHIGTSVLQGNHLTAAIDQCGLCSERTRWVLVLHLQGGLNAELFVSLLLRRMMRRRSKPVR